MNKDVIYIEPEDDITDIISALESTKEKIVAIVPPKKSAVLKSIVNIKLIAKTGAAEGKNVVLVTTDPATIKLAAAVKLPVTKDLQSAPSVPKEEDIPDEITTEEVIEEVPEEPKEKIEEPESEEDKEVSEVIKENEKAKAEKVEKTEKEEKEEKKEKKVPTNPIAKWFVENKKWAIIGGSTLGALILFLVWAFVIAPAVKITVTIRTDSNNFSESISFTTDQTKEDAEKGIFYLEEIKDEKTQKVEFEATGEKNVGKKATGELIVYAFFGHNGETEGSVSVNTGTVFNSNGLIYYATEDAVITFKDGDRCDNEGDARSTRVNGCQKSTSIKVEAAEPGEQYNTSDNTAVWTSNAHVHTYMANPVVGGTDKKVTVITKDDLAKAKTKVVDENKLNEVSIKEDLFEKIGDDKMVIDSSFKQEVSDPESTPKVDEEVKENTKPSAEIKTTTSIYVIDKTKVEEFIANKAKLSESQKIYSFKDPFIENFLAVENGYTGKLKTTYYTGAKVTENDILDLAKGRGLGDIQHDIKSKFENIDSITIDKSFPWVNSAPGDTNKIEINLEIKDSKQSLKE